MKPSNFAAKRFGVRLGSVRRSSKGTARTSVTARLEARANTKKGRRKTKGRGDIAGRWNGKTSHRLWPPAGGIETRLLRWPAGNLTNYRNPGRVGARGKGRRAQGNVK